MSIFGHLLIIIFLTISLSAKNTSALTKEKLTISYVYSLAKYIDFNTNNKLFSISLVSSNNKLNKEFKKLVEHTKINGKKIKLYISEDKNIYTNANIIFIDKEKNHLYKKIFLKTKDTKSLLISNGYTDKKFVMINLFVTKKNTMKFEINRANILSKGLGIDPDIILLGGTELDIAYLYKDTRDSLSSKEVELKKIYTKLNTSRKALRKQQSKLTAMKDKLASLKKTNLTFKKKIIEKEKTLQLTKKEIAQYNIDVKKLKDYLKEKNLAIDTKESKLSTLLEEFTSTRKELKQIKSSLDAKMLKSHELEVLILTKTKILEELKLRLEKKNTLIQTREETITSQKEILWIAFATLIFILIIIVIISYLLKKQKTTNTLLKKTQEELKIAKDKADVASQNKSKFVASMSHELRTPLNAVLGYSQLLQNDMSIAQKHQETFSIIRKSGEHLLGLINNILLISKMESGNIQVHNTSANVRDILDGMYSMFLLKTQQKNVELELIIDSEFPQYIETDIDILRQILINLLNNSVKFTNAGSIKIFAKYSDENLIITIEDTGVGIAKDEIDILFKQYQQTQSGIKEGNGTGLGLSLVNEFIKVLDGTISVESEYEQGSSFTIALPCSVVNQHEDSEIKTITGLMENQKKFKVLIVDDVRDNRNLLARLLEATGFVTEEASDGLEAVSCVKKQRPDMILMDLRMPNMDGNEATKIILEIDKTIPVIAVTASILEMETLIHKPEPFVAVMPKPFDNNKLLHMIADYVDVKYNYAQTTVLKEVALSTIKSLNSDDISKLLKAISSANLTLINELINSFDTIDSQEKQYIEKLVKEFNFEELEKILN